MYNIWFKHSSDSTPSIVDVVATKAEAIKNIKDQVKYYRNIGSCTVTVRTIEPVTNIRFDGVSISWSIGLWYEKA